MVPEKDSLFFQEEALLKEALALAGSERFRDNPLRPHYAELIKGYRKLLKQMQRLVRISDTYHHALSSSAEELAWLSSTDTLTGLANRLCLQQHLDREWRICQREKRPLSLMMIDIDHFKDYNDTYGHLQGDECLRLVAGAIKAALARPADLLARYGGEEFVAVLPGVELAGAQVVAERIMDNIRSLGLEHGQSPVCATVTVSIGLAATVPRPGDASSDLIQEADRALYTAKFSGRNRSVACIKQMPRDAQPD